MQKKDTMPKKTGKGKQYLEVTLAEIQVNPDNPRKNFTGPKFDELVASVRKVGVMQPITIRPVKGKVPYMIVFGERRYNASVLIANENGGIKKNTIPSIVRELTDDEALDPENALNFVNMYRSFMTAGGFKDGYFISHKPSCRALADNNLMFEAGSSPAWN